MPIQDQSLINNWIIINLPASRVGIIFFFHSKEERETKDKVEGCVQEGHADCRTERGR